ncbi:F0F1 ATP synthase subunit B [Patescibacteria group bacterium]|nr:F0F1 ATP synthase subunit B [Patescibacteria group bacterium]
MELIEKLGIDWRLIIAQMVNFLILLAVLYKFLYKPVLKMLTDRTKKIEQGIKDAERIKDELVKAETQKEQKILAAKKEAESIVLSAQKVAEENRQKYLAQTKKEAQEVVDKAKVQIANEKEKMIKEVRADVSDMVAMATNKVLEDVVDEEVDKKVVEHTISKL